MGSGKGAFSNEKVIVLWATVGRRGKSCKATGLLELVVSETTGRGAPEAGS